MTVPRFLRPLAVVVALGLLAAVAFGSTAGATRQDVTDPALIKAARQAIENAKTPPRIVGPKQAIKPPTGKTIGVIPCGLSSFPCVRMSDQVQRAAAAMGWKSIVADGALSAQGYAAAMDQLIGRGVDGIVRIAIPDAVIPNQMAEAKAKNIPVICMVCGNHLLPAIAAPSTYNLDPDYARSGKLAADYAIVQTGGKAKVVLIRNAGAPSAQRRLDGVEAELKKCAGCSVVTTEFTVSSADRIAAGMAQMQAILGKFSDPASVNWLIVPSDTGGLGHIQYVQGSGRDISVSGFDCDTLNLDYIRMGKAERDCIDGQYSWLAWTATHQLARVLLGMKPARDAYVPIVLVDKTNVPGADARVVPSPDFESYYKKLWGKK